MHLPTRPPSRAWRRAALWLAASTLAAAAHAEKIGTVDTAFQWIGRDHDILVEAYDDPGALGVTCYVSRARTGGIKGTLGLAEDRAEASIACRQTGPISFPKPLRKQEEVFSERMSILFKRLRIVRMVDAPRNTLVYLTYSEKAGRRLAAKQHHCRAHQPQHRDSAEEVNFLSKKAL